MKNPKIILKDNKSYDSLGHLLNGKVEYYFPNGNIQSSCFYKNGILTGDWYQYGLDKEIVQEGKYIQDTNFENLVQKKVKIDYLVLDIWKEGNVDFISAYINLKSKGENLTDSLMNEYANYLTLYKIKNKEILFLLNEDTVMNKKFW